MKRHNQGLLSVALLFILSLNGQAAVYVNDTWIDGNRTDPLPQTYSENGTDADSDGDIESAWFAGGSGGLSVSNDNVNVTPGVLRMTTASGSSSSWTTYFTPDVSPIILANEGDQLKITWVFKPTGVNSGSTGQSFRMAIVDTPNAARIDPEGSPGSAAYAGYGMFMNMNTTLGNGNPFQLRKRSDFTATAALLSSSGAWSSLADQENSGVTGYEDGVEYTFVFTATRNAVGQLDINATMSGGNIGGDGMLEVSYLDEAPDTFTFDTFSLRPSSMEDFAMVTDTSLFKVEGPGAVDTKPEITLDPQDVSRVVGQLAVFNSSAIGTPPLHYQWYFNTNTVLAGETNASLALMNVQMSQAGTYHVIVTNNQGSATSLLATLTVEAPVYTPTGLILDDRWFDGDRISGPVAISNAIWFASDASSLTAFFDQMQAVSSTSSRLWLGYFTDDPATPVDLAVGRSLKATLVFTPSNVATQNTGSLRLGMFNYADGGGRIINDPIPGGGSGGAATNVTGYMLLLNFGETFGLDNPMSIQVRNNYLSDSLMGTTGDYLELGIGPPGQSNSVAFENGMEYTLMFTITRNAENSVDVTTSVTGGSVNISHTETDTDFHYRRFDSFAIRANRNFDSADTFTFTQFRVEVEDAPVVPIPLSLDRSGGNVVLSWGNPAFALQASSNVAAGYTNIAGATSPYTNAVTGGRSYFRLIGP